MCIDLTTPVFPLQNALSVLGIPFADIMRVLSAILLLGNLEFVEGPGLELEVEGDAGKSIYRPSHGLIFWLQARVGRHCKSMPKFTKTGLPVDVYPGNLYICTINNFVI